MGEIEERHPVLQTVATLTGLASAVYATWCTVIAFIGGRLPIIGIEIDGSFGLGILWVIVIDPIVVTVCYWLSLVVMMPFAAVAGARQSKHRSPPPTTKPASFSPTPRDAPAQARPLAHDAEDLRVTPSGIGTTVECLNGHENPAGQSFCGQCGQPLGTQQATTATISELSRPSLSSRHRYRVWALATAIAVVVATAVTITAIAISRSEPSKPRPRTSPSTAATPAASAAPTSPTSTGVPPPPTPPVPSASDIASEMARTVEIDDPSTNFEPIGEPVTVSDGESGTLTAAIGRRSPSGDGTGQLIFFWHNTSFLGWHSDREATRFGGLSGVGPRHISAVVNVFGPTDPLCCPTLPPVAISYQWIGQRIVPSAPLPKGAVAPTRVKRLR
jgi:LppP/LprE lipoprotein